MTRIIMLNNGGKEKSFRDSGAGREGPMDETSRMRFVLFHGEGARMGRAILKEAAERGREPKEFFIQLTDAQKVAIATKHGIGFTIEDDRDWEEIEEAPTSPGRETAVDTEFGFPVYVRKGSPMEEAPTVPELEPGEQTDKKAELSAQRINDVIWEMMSAASGCPFNRRVFEAISSGLKERESSETAFGENLRRASRDEPRRYLRMVKEFARHMVEMKKDKWNEGKY